MNQLASNVRRPMVPKRGVVGLLEKRVLATSGLGLTDAVDLIGEYNHYVEDPMTIGSDLGHHNNHGEDPATDPLSIVDDISFNMDRARGVEDTVTFGNHVHIALDGYQPPGAGSHSMTANETLLAGHAVYVSANNTVNLADADALETSHVLGLASANASANSAATVLSVGSLTLPDWTSVTGSANLVPGAVYYLSTTPGNLTLVPPVGTNDVVVRLGLAITTTKFEIEVNEVVTL